MPPQPQKSRLKRLPSHSYTIIFKFDSDEKRDNFLNSKEFIDFSSELGRLIFKHDMKGIDKIKWDVVSGSKTDEKEE